MPINSEEYARPATPPNTSNLSEVRGASRECTACHLYKRATQTVFGEGPKNTPIMLVGEQPGDYEDIAGKPFVGWRSSIWKKPIYDALVHS
jgi:uracil-DNA glycosylase